MKPKDSWVASEQCHLHIACSDRVEVVVVFDVIYVQGDVVDSMRCGPFDVQFIMRLLPCPLGQAQVVEGHADIWESDCVIDFSISPAMMLLLWAQCA